MSLLTQPVNFRNFADTASYIINDQTSLRSGWSIAPHYYINLEAAEGFYGADITSESHPVPHDTGERSWDSFRKGKGITLSGEIEGRNVSDLENAAIFLQEMFWDMRERKLIWTQGGVPAYMKLRVINDIAITESYSIINPKWAWTVGLRANDPRFRKVSDDSLLYSWMT